MSGFIALGATPDGRGKDLVFCGDVCCSMLDCSSIVMLAIGMFNARLMNVSECFIGTNVLKHSHFQRNTLNKKGNREKCLTRENGCALAVPIGWLSDLY